MVRHRHDSYDRAGWQGRTAEESLRREPEDGTYSDMYIQTMWVGWLGGIDFALAEQPPP